MSFFPKQPSSRVGVTQTIAFDASVGDRQSVRSRNLSASAGREFGLLLPDRRRRADGDHGRRLPAGQYRRVCHRQPGPAHLGDQGRQQRARHRDRRHAVGYGDVVMDGVLIRPHLDSNGQRPCDRACPGCRADPGLEQRGAPRGAARRLGRGMSRAFPTSSTCRWLDEEHARGNTSLAAVHARVRPDRAEETRRSRMGLFANGQAEIAGRLVSGVTVTQIVDYASLQTAVTEYLARDQDATLIARIPTFIQLAEAKFNRQLFVRQMEQRATAVVDLASSEPEFISLPSDFQSMRRVRLSSVTGKPCLEFKSGTQIDEYRFGTSDVAGAAALLHGVRQRDRTRADAGCRLHGRDGLSRRAFRRSRRTAPTGC